LSLLNWNMSTANWINWRFQNWALSDIKTSSRKRKVVESGN